jgi:2-polyprenyl-3-methyl-5-hydroxy-6-metoxy-1,4-benzoquinol methylase
MTTPASRPSPPTPGRGQELACYLCGSTELEVLSRELRHGPGMVWLCPRCSLGILELQPEQRREYYEGEYRDRHGPRIGQRSGYQEIFDSYVRYQGERVKLLRPWLAPGQRLLDVGCSTGHFLYNVKDLVDEVAGIDYDPAAAAFAAEACGCETFSGDLEASGLEPESFDVVTSIQVMEHVEDPVEFAATLGRYLKPGGTVYVEVPNLDDALRAAYREPAYSSFYFHEAHSWYFTASSLRAVMERAGFVDGEIHHLQDYNFLNHLHWLTHHGPQESCHPGLAPPSLPVTGDASGPLVDEVNAWLAAIEEGYRALLAKHGATDNVAFIGRRKD